MSNLTSNEYFKDFYNTPNDYNKLIRVVRIDSADSYYRKKGVYFTPFYGEPGDSKYTAIVLVAIFRTEKKKFTIGHYIINNYEDDNETIKKGSSNKYLIFDGIIDDDNFNKKELDAFELDSVKQLDRINKYIQYSVNDYSGTWSIIQDPWDPNVVVDFIPNNPRDTKHDVVKTTPPPEKIIEPVVIPPVVIPPPIKLQCDFNFSVKKENTFLITSGNNGNLVSLPDGTIVDLGELSVVKKEDPNDPEIIRILTPYSDELVELDSEYTDENFSGMEEELVFLEPNGEISQESANSIKGYDPENPDDSLSTDNGAKYPISKNQDKNIKAIIKVAKDSGITNGYSIAAMLAICKKESGLVPQSEASYSGTAASHIKSVFKKFRKYTDTEVDKIKKDAKKFFDIIYGSRFDNGPDEGYKYRGRGFNQITFKGNYVAYKKLSGHDIVGDPDLLNTVDVAAKCLVEYFKSNFSDASKNIKSKYNFTDINSFKSLKDATGAFYHANAGFSKSFDEIVADSTGGRGRAFSYVEKLYKDYLGPDRKK